MSEKPFPDSYWVIPGRFLAGAYPASPEGLEVFSRLRLMSLVEAGMDTFFDLTRPGELPAYLPVLQEEAQRHNLSITYQRHPAPDRGLMPVEQMAALLDGIEAALQTGRKVYLHCWGGIGRTGTAVGCWLVRRGQKSSDALTRLNELYQDSEQHRFYAYSPETNAQIQYILNWKEPAQP
jgi:hypothetical protein